MTLNNVQLAQSEVMGSLPSKRYLVQNPTASSVTAPAINAGEPVAKALASEYVTVLATNKPVVATDFLAGISTDTSTESGSNDGFVNVTPVDCNVVYMCTANNTALIATQALYNALIGARVLFSKSAANNTGVYTVLLSDSSTSGLVVEYNDVIANPGKVAFSFRTGLSYKN